MKITRAMELIAASRIPKAQARVTASKPYADQLVEVIRNVYGASSGATHPLLEEREIKTVGMLVVASDRGLAGAYASNIIRMAETAALAHEGAGRSVRIYAVGKKANDYFAYRKYTIVRSLVGVTDMPGYGDARAIANMVMDGHASEALDSVEAYYTQYQSAITQVPSFLGLVPIARPEAAEPDETVASVDYSYEPEPAEILGRLLPRYIEALIFNMLLQSSASEHSARRRAMKAATDNAEDLIILLTRVANRARQAEITTEISEIVGGAEALSLG